MTFDKKEYLKEWRLKNKERFQIWCREYREKNKESLKNMRWKYDKKHYKKRKDFISSKKKYCVECGYDKYPEILEFHHIVPINRTKKREHNILSFSIGKLREEVKRCIVLCPNCHSLLHHGNIINKNKCEESYK